MKIFNIIRMVTVVFLALLGFYALGYCQEKNPKTEAKTHYEMGNIFYQQGRFEEAQQEYQKAIKILKQYEQAVPQKKEVAGIQKIGTIQKEPSLTEKKEVKPGFNEYLIGEDDLLKISIWQNPDLNQEVTVRPDGLISFPLIGDVQAKGYTITELDQEITTRLREYIRLPEVSISLQKIGGSRVILLGEIRSPGVYSVTGTKTILEAIGQAGGFSRDAVPSSVVLIRGGLSLPQAQRLNLSKVLQGREVHQQNVVLQSQDIIFVPRKFISDINYFLGQIIDPLSKGVYTSRELKGY